MNYHYGRIRLNEAIMAIQMGNIRKAENLLAETEEKIKKWDDLLGNLAMAYLLLHEESKAVAVIRAALSQNPKWEEHLPAFYLLKDEPGMKELIDEKKFAEKDWISAVSFLGELNRDAEAACLTRKALQLFPGSSCLHYLLGKALLATGKQDEAKKELQEAVNLDLSNNEAINFLQHTISREGIFEIISAGSGR